MPVININIKDLASVLTRMSQEQEPRVVEAIRRTVRERGQDMALQTVEAAKPKPVDRGTYRQSFRVDNVPRGASMTNYAPHAGVIEYGRRAGARMPPINVIEEWLRRKLRVAIKEGRQEKMTPAAWRGAAYVVARAIGRRGLPPHNILAKVNLRLQPLVLEAVMRALAIP